jgi:DHA1 family bicyclomycin/chloramphenicol resistance-like MFS transporter
VAFGMLVAMTVTLLPETSSPHERTQVRLRDAAGTYARLLHNAPFMRYVLTGACSVGILLAYITGSSFVYNETLRVTPGLFAVLFGVNAIGFIGAHNSTPSSCATKASLPSLPCCCWRCCS